MKISVVIPVFNEEKDIGDCLNSLLDQTYKHIEIIVVDDASTDKTLEVLSEFKIKNSEFKILKQNHLGAGHARNLGSKTAKGDILVFVDADMIFDKLFLDMLTKPIREGKMIGTFSKEEYVLNRDNVWSKCWNINKDLPITRMHRADYPNKQRVFRAIKKDEFIKSGGFEPIGYIDDYTISEKLGVFAEAADRAIFYHKNPDTLQEVFTQACWIGGSEYKRRKIKNEFLMKLISIIRYSMPPSIINGFYKSIKYKIPEFIFFKIIYDLGIETSLIKSFFKDVSAK